MNDQLLLRPQHLLIFICSVSKRISSLVPFQSTHTTRVISPSQCVYYNTCTYIKKWLLPVGECWLCVAHWASVLHLCCDLNPNGIFKVNGKVSVSAEHRGSRAEKSPSIREREKLSSPSWCNFEACSWQWVLGKCPHELLHGLIMIMEDATLARANRIIVRWSQFYVQAADVICLKSLLS